MKTINEILAESSGIQLDIGCGATKQPGYIGLDVRDLPGVDIIQDINKHPWELPDECVLRALSSHLIEHIPPVAFDPNGNTRFPFIEFMNEVWRILKFDGQFAISMPHGMSPGFYQDPTHINPRNEATWAYFDPLEPSTGGFLYKIYKPKPWKIVSLNFNPYGNMEVLLIKRREDATYYE